MLAGDGAADALRPRISCRRWRRRYTSPAERSRGHISFRTCTLTGPSMTNDAVGADRSPASKPRETDEPEGPTCYACTALVDDSGPTNDTGALLRLCPVCG